MNAYEPRLLSPSALDIPSHMRVSHDPAVYEEYANPAVTAVIYTPHWSKPVAQLFNKLSQHARRDVLNTAKQIKTALQLRPHLAAENERMLTFVMLENYNWMRPLIEHKPDAEQKQLVSDISYPQQDMLGAFARLALAGKPVSLERHYRPFGPSHASGKFLFNPHDPHQRYAHIDHGPTAIFSHVAGTILVDQDDLDLKEKTRSLKDSQGRQAYGIAQEDLAGRIWQVPAASFLLMKGGRNNPQYHFFPHAQHDVLRHKLIAFGVT